MPRFKRYSYDRSRMIPIDFRSQLQPGTFEFALNHLVDEEDESDACVPDRKFRKSVALQSEAWDHRAGVREHLSHASQWRGQHQAG